MSSEMVSDTAVGESMEAEEGEWEEWEEDDDNADSSSCAVCLFCPSQLPSAAGAFAHMRDAHQFDFLRLRGEKGLDYYDSVRVINFIREQVAFHRCIACGAQFDGGETLMSHMQSNKHFWLPVSESSSKTAAETADGAGGEIRSSRTDAWADDTYLRPVLDNDTLLYSFEEEDELKEVEMESQMEEGRQALAQVAAAKARQSGIGDRAMGDNMELGNTDELIAEIEDLRRRNRELKDRMAAMESGMRLRPRRAPPKTPHPTPVSSPSPSFSEMDASPPRDIPSSLGMVREVEGEEDDIPEEEEEDFAEGESREEEEGDREEENGEEEEAAYSAYGDQSSLASVERALETSYAPGRRGPEWGGHLGPGGRRSRHRGGVPQSEAAAIDRSYFKSYGAFGIHREMLSDKPRTAAYEAALLGNPTLLRDAVVLDVGCGTGILSLFAAKAGAAKVVAVDASEKIAAVAAKIAEDNGYLEGSSGGTHPPARPVISVVCGVVEKLQPEGPEEVGLAHDDSHGKALSTAEAEEGNGRGVGQAGPPVLPLPRGGADVLVSEWMGYCLLYESMLSTVLRARDTWLKPGGAILPDIATMFLAGFGRGGTSLPFWENVYGFDMSHVGKEVNASAAEVPIIDAVEAKDLITTTCPIQTLDLATMREEAMDFTSYFHLTLLEEGPVASASHAADDAGTGPGEEARRAKESSSSSGGGGAPDSTQWCHGVVVWFDVEFSKRFCMDTPVVLSTSPRAPSTHWSQTILTFREPILLARAGPSSGSPLPEARPLSQGTAGADVAPDARPPRPPLPSRSRQRSESIGTAAVPAVAVSGRISVARRLGRRSIDISVETAALSPDGTVRRFPAQFFDLS